MLKFLQWLWDKCGTMKGSCQILCVLITLLTVQNIVLNIVPPELSGLVIGTNILLWVFTSFIDDD